MAGGLQNPQRRQWPQDRPERVHQALQAKRTAIRAGRYLRGQQSFFCRRPHTTAQPCRGTPNQNVNSLGSNSKGRGCNRRKRITENRERLSALQLVRVVTRGEFRKTRKAVR